MNDEREDEHAQEQELRGLIMEHIIRGEVNKVAAKKPAAKPAAKKPAAGPAAEKPPNPPAGEQQHQHQWQSQCIFCGAWANDAENDLIDQDHQARQRRKRDQERQDYAQHLSDARWRKNLEQLGHKDIPEFLRDDGKPKG